MAISPRTSDKIRIIGVLMTAIVVIHTAYDLPYAPGQAPGWLRYPENLVHVGLRLLAVPFFLICSGFFLCDRPDFRDAWPGELRKRVRSLLVPYALWCGGWIVLMWALQRIPALAAAFGRDRIALTDGVQIARLMTIEPIPHPLWYLRDVFLLTALSPLIVRLLRRRWSSVVYFAAALAVFYSRPSLETREAGDLLFFGIGAWIALHRPRVPAWPAFVPLALAAASAALMIAHCRWVDAHGSETPWIIDSAALLGLPAVWLLYDRVERLVHRPALLLASRYSLFVYLAHAPALELARKAAVLTFGTSPATLALIWGGISLGAIATSIALACLLERAAPGLYRLLIGGRGVTPAPRTDPAPDPVATLAKGA